MARLTDFKTPTGATGNILDPSSWLALIVGSAVLLITFAMGQNLANKVGAKVPFVDATIERPYTVPERTTQYKGPEVI